MKAEQSAAVKLKMASFKPPKPYRLSKVETIVSFEQWKFNQIYNLQMDPNFGPFIARNTEWKKQSSTNANRGLVDDDAEMANKKTAAEKCNILTLMLDQIASWCPFISRTMIVKQSISLNDVWQKIREHYGFLSSGAQFLDLSLVKQDPDDGPEDLYQKLFMFFEDNLVKANGLRHNGDVLDTDEEITPSIENAITWFWLNLLHPGLPQLVKQRYGSELRNKTLASLKTEISQSISSLLDELASVEETRVFRSFNKFKSGNSNSYNKQWSNSNSGKSSVKSCTLCKAAGRAYNSHWLSQCKFLTHEDRRALARAILTSDCDDESQQEEPHQDDPLLDADDAGNKVRRVSNIQSPILDVTYRSGVLYVTVDCGATANLMRESTARRFGIVIHPATQRAGQADGKTNLDTVGEVHFTVNRGNRSFKFDGLVVKNLNDDILGGMPFMKENDIAVRPAKSWIVIEGKEVIAYNSKGVCTPMVRRVQSYVLRGPKQRLVVLPGEDLPLETPKDALPNSTWALEPRYDSNSPDWFLPREVTDCDRMISIKNTTNEPIVIGKHEHVCQVRSVIDIRNEAIPSTDIATPVLEDKVKVQSCNSGNASPFSDAVCVNPDGLVSQDIVDKVHEINRAYDRVFNPVIPRYNGHSGNIMGHINMGPVSPPQRKGRTPQYNREKLLMLQEKFDELEACGVFAKPEEIGVVAEYMNLSFLTQKPSGGYRLVTAFSEIGEYSKPQPSIMPNIDDTLRTIGQWKFLIKTDLQKAYYQIPLSKESMHYCGVATPYKGVRVYTRCAMGLPGSETALEELMNRVVGDLIMEGNAAKVADDLYCGGDNPLEVLKVWSRLLKALAENNLGLSAAKTIIFPKSTIVLGWVWEDGTYSASSHRISALAAVSPPSTVRGMRSFIGAYKFMSRVIKGYSNNLHPLEHAIAGKQSQDKMEWTDDLLLMFRKVQESLNDCQVICIAKPDDRLWIVTDGAKVTGGIAATLYLLRDGKRLLGGFFNAQLRKGQVLWLPCEVEALAIGSAVTHFAPILIQSKHHANVLTDNQPCVDAYKRMRRGLFSNSSRVLTFLTAVARYQVQVSHIAGEKIPFTDFASRNVVECSNECCQVCKFVQEFSELVVRKLTVADILSGQANMPFINRKAWLETQRDCPDLRRLHAFLLQGTRPTKKMNKIRDVKTYLQRVVIARDGLLVVKDSMPFQKEFERIVVPQGVIHGLLSAYHLRFEHPSSHQLKRIMARYFYAINLDKSVDSLTDACDLCNGLKFVPDGLCTQSSVDPPSQVGTSFAFDVIKREKQLIAVLRETVTSYTVSSFVDSENHKDLRDVIIVLSASVKCVGSEIRVDPGPGLACLAEDSILKAQGISMILGNSKNKNPVAERAIEELEIEILKIAPDKGPITKVTLALATAATNSRIRRDKLSSRELWTKRDQLTGKAVLVDDKVLIDNQVQSREANHHHSAKSKARGRPASLIHPISIGSLIYLKSERSKLQARNQYIVSSIGEKSCTIRKFVNGQYRAKTYPVKLTDIYPVLGAKPGFSKHHEYGSDSESSDSEKYDGSQPYDDHSTDSLQDSEDDHDAGAERPQRNRRQPVRFNSYEMGSDYV